MNYIEELASKVYKPGMSNEEFLIQLYTEAVLEDGIRNNPQQTEAERKLEKEYHLQSIKERIKSTRERGYTPHPLSYVLNRLYDLRRHINFPLEKNSNLSELEATLNQSSTIVDPENKSGWQYRYPKKRKRLPGGTKERFVVNANPDPKLIETLDKFCQDENAYYKVPEIERWDARVDTAIIYMQDNITPEQQKKLIQLMTPFIRTTNPQHTNTLDGTLIATGIARAKEVSGDEAKKYISTLPEDIQEDVSLYLTNRQQKIGMSLGQKCVLEEFLPLYLKMFPQRNSNEVGIVSLTAQPKSTPKPILTENKEVKKQQPQPGLLKRLETLSKTSAATNSKKGVRQFSELGMTKNSPTSLFYKKQVGTQTIDIVDSTQMYKMLKQQDLKTVQNIYSRAIMCMHDCAKTPETNTQDYLLAYGIAFSCVAVFSDEAKKNNIPFDPIPLKNKYIETIEMVSNDIERGIIPSSTQLTQNSGFLINNKQLRRFDSRKYLEGIYKDGQFSEYNLEGMSFKSIKDSRAIIKDLQSLSSKHLVQSIQNQH